MDSGMAAANADSAAIDTGSGNASWPSSVLGSWAIGGAGVPRSRSLQVRIAATCAQADANRVVGRIPAASCEPSVWRTAIAPVGSSVSEQVLIARNRHIAL